MRTILGTAWVFSSKAFTSRSAVIDSTDVSHPKSSDSGASSQYADVTLSKKGDIGPWANPSRKPKIRLSSIDQSWDSVYFLLPAVPVCIG